LDDIMTMRIPVGLLGATLSLLSGAQAQTLPNPILFVTQVPIPADFTTIGSTFGHQSGEISSVGRGGDLYIRYPNGTLRNLTAEAGFGSVGLQGATAIAVRDVELSFDATKAVFSMVIGAPTQFQQAEYYWQLYEITGFGVGQTAVITKLANQPANYNNIEPAYLSDGKIVFVSDRPRSGERHLYPQQDEYESAPTPTGLWRLDPGTGALTLMQHSPSGSFDPVVDSFGRLLYVRWDHLQRDQQADASGNPFGNFNWLSEAQNAPFAPLLDVFPEVRVAPNGAQTNGHTFNTFLPWMLHQDGTAEETINHLGRHELHSYFNRSFSDDPNLIEFTPGTRPNALAVRNVTMLALDPSTPGRQRPDYRFQRAAKRQSRHGAV
jgi:hypothetical protein